MNKKSRFGFKNLVALLLAWCMVVQSMAGNVSLVAWGAEREPIKLTGVSLYTSDGTQIEDDAEVSMAQPVKLRYTFAVAYQEGDARELKFDLPKQLAIDSKLSFRISSVDEDNFAKVVVDTSGEVTLTLLPLANKLDVDEIWFEITASWNLDDIKEKNEEKLEFKIGEATIKEINLTVTLPDDLKATMKVEKKGVYFKEDNVVEWTVEITPGTTPIDCPVKNVVFTDEIEADQEFVDGSATCVLKSDTNQADRGSFSRAAFGFAGSGDSMETIIPASPSNAETDSIVYDSDDERPDTALTDSDVKTYGTPSDATLSDADRWESDLGDKIFALPSFMSVKESLQSGFEYKNKTLTYTFPEAISDTYVIQYRTKLVSDQMDEGKFTHQTGKAGDTYRLDNTATVAFPKNAIGEPGKPGSDDYPYVSAEASVEHPIEYILKDGEIVDKESLVRWSVSVNPSGMKVKDAVIVDTFNPSGKKFLKLIDGTVKYGDKELTLCGAPSKETLNGRTVTVCLDKNSSHYCYDENTRVITYYLGDITDPGTFTYDTKIDQTEYAAAGSPDISNNIELGGNGGWYGKGAAVIQPTKGWILKEGIGYDPHTHYVTWRVTVNRDGQSLKNAVFSDVLKTDSEHTDGQIYVADSFKVDGNKQPLSSVAKDDSKKEQTLTYEFGDINETHTIEFQTELLNPKYYNANISGKLICFNEAKLNATYHSQPIEATHKGTQDIHSTVLTKTAAKYDDTNRLMTWMVGVNANQTPITNGVVKDELTEDLQYAYVSGDTVVPIKAVADIEKAVIWVDANGTPLAQPPTGVTVSTIDSDVTKLQIAFDSTWNDGKKYPCYFKLTTTFRDGKFEELFGQQNEKVTLKNTATLSAGNIAKVDVSAQQDVTNIILGKTAIYEAGEDTITWRVLINENKQAVPVTSNIGINTIHILDKLDPGLVLDVDTVKLYEISSKVSSNGKLNWDEILKDAKLKESTFGKYNVNGTATGNICYDNTSNEFRYFLAPGTDKSFNIDPIDKDTILKGKTYVLEFQTDILPAASSAGTIENDISMIGASKGPTSSGSADGVHYSTGQGGGTGRKGAIKIIKKDKYSGDVLEGVPFTLEDVKDMHEPLDLQPVKVSTNNKGEAIFSMLYYNIPYELTETDPASSAYLAPQAEDIVIPDKTPGVTVDKDTNTLTLLKSGLQTTNGVLTVNVTNRPKLGWIELRKQSTNQYGKDNVYLNGAEITVYDAATGKKADMWLTTKDGTTKEKVPAVLTTATRDGESGWVTFEGLRCGTYYMKETKAPDGYAVTDEKIYFQITTDKYSEDGLRGDQTADQNADRGVYCDESGQTIDDNNSPWILKNAPAGNIKVKKVEYGKTDILLKGAQFAIYKSSEDALAGKNVIGSVQTTDAKGECTFSGLAEGTYFIKEQKAPDHYVVMDGGITEVELKAEKQGTEEKLVLYQGTTAVTDGIITVANLPRGQFKLTKTDCYNGAKLAGAEITLTCTNLTYPDKETLDPTTWSEEVHTDKNGIAAFDNLPYGTYTWKETNLPKGYVAVDEYNGSGKASEAPTEGTITIERVAAVEYELKNRPVLGNYEFLKTDQKKNAITGTQIIGDAPTFQLFDNANYTETPLKNEAHDASGKDISTDTFKADESGLVLFKYLRPGTYYFKETAGPDNYDRVATGSFTIGDSVTDDQRTIRIDGGIVVNWETGKFTIHKVDSRSKDKEILLDGASINIVAVQGDRDDSLPTDGHKFTGTNPLKIPGGELTVELQVGWYYYQETKAPDNFEMDSAKHYFEVKHGDTGTYDPSVGKLVNRALGKLVVHKTDASDSKPISGVEFTLVKTNTNKTWTKTTDSAGNIEFEGLEQGEYTCTETATPEGYFGYGKQPSYTFTIDVDNGKENIVWDCQNWPIKAKLQLSKLDSVNDSPLSGAEFTLEKKNGSDWTSVGAVTTDKDGLAVTELLSPGSYRMVESKAPVNYGFEAGKAPAVEFKIPVSVDLTQSYEEVKDAPYLLITTDTAGKDAKVYNEPRGSFMLTKVDSTDSEKLLDGAEITLTKDGKTIQVLTTGMAGQEQGTVVFTDLAYGTYHWEETGVPEGYIKGKTTGGDVTIGQPGQNKDQNVTLANRPIPMYQLEITKTGEPNNRPLQGAVIGIYKYKADQNADGTLIQEITTGTDGKATLSNMLCTSMGDTADNYYYQELAAPTGYILDSAKYPFHLEDDGTDDKNKVLKLSLENKLARGSFSFKKVGKDAEASPLAGAKFQLTYVGAGSVGASDPMPSQENKRVVTTAEDGMVVFDQLPYGEYICQEIQAPDGYHLDKSWKVNVTMDSPTKGLVSDVNDSANTYVNYGLYFGYLKITKTGSDGQPLSGAKYGVYSRSNGQPVANVAESITGDDGTVTIGPLYEGDYYVKELAAPPHYALDDSHHDFSIVDDQSTVEMTVVNQKLVKGSLRVIKTGDGKEPLPGAVIGLYETETDNLIGKQTTDSLGIAQFDGLEKDEQIHYYYKELTAPEGYLLDETRYPVAFAIEKEGQMVTVALVNHLKRGSFQLTKVKKGTEEPLQGADISVFKKDGSIVESKTTGADGKVLFTGLPIGDYYYEETKAPSGYVKDTEQHPFTITEHEQLLTMVLENTRRSSGGGGGTTPPNTSTPPTDTTTPGPGNPPQTPTLPETPQLPQVPVDPENPDTLPPVDPGNPPPSIPTEKNPDGTHTVVVPEVPPRTDIIVTDSHNKVAYKGKTDDFGTFNATLSPDSYVLLAIDDENVPLAQFVFTIEDEDVPLGSLPKTGERSRIPAMWEYIVLAALLGTCILDRKTKRKKNE